MGLSNPTLIRYIWKQSFIIELVAKKVNSKWNCAISILCHENSKDKKEKGSRLLNVAIFFLQTIGNNRSNENLTE